MRRIGAIAIAAVAVAVFSACTGASVYASYGIGGSSVGCQASTSATEFNGNCIVLEGPTEPTQPSLDHHWSTSQPTIPPACTPYDFTEWALAEGTTGGGAGGGTWTVEGQRIPIVYSTPITDWGWVYTIDCGSSASLRFTRLVFAPRSPSPCSLQTKPAACRPGLDASAFLAAVAGQVPSETIQATPTGPGIVGIAVRAWLSPTPVTKYAEIDISEPDVGDSDPGEILHVVWVVQATPEIVSWTWPDGSASSNDKWIPQTYVADGMMRATVVYSVTATGFWSDGVNVHDLPSVSVGTIPITAQLGYSVEQVQAGLG